MCCIATFPIRYILFLHVLFRSTIFSEHVFVIIIMILIYLKTVAIFLLKVLLKLIWLFLYENYLHIFCRKLSDLILLCWKLTYIFCWQLSDAFFFFFWKISQITHTAPFGDGGRAWASCETATPSSSYILLNNFYSDLFCLTNDFICNIPQEAQRSLAREVTARFHGSACVGELYQPLKNLFLACRSLCVPVSFNFQIKLSAHRRSSTVCKVTCLIAAIQLMFGASLAGCSASLLIGKCLDLQLDIQICCFS